MAALIANLLIAAVAAYAAVLHEGSPGDYYREVQEDGPLEWASFWAFALAGGVAIWGAVAQRRATRLWPWFFAALAAFCWLVAMEEISWGQRLLGFRPPPYFLSENYQQELNFHNVLSTSLRKLGVLGVIAGYGILLPLLALWPRVRRWFDRFAIVPPPFYLMPSFVAMAALYVAYPWRHTGEWVEMMLGLGFLFGVAMPARSQANARDPLLNSAPGWLVGSWALALALGVATAAASRLGAPDPRYLAAAGREVAALKLDLERARPQLRCGVHKRLYSFVRQYGQVYLTRGAFTRLQSDGLAPERAAFFLDPWNSPYWIRFDCRSSPRRIIVYSLGPNRRRDSSRQAVLGDDVGAALVR